MATWLEALGDMQAALDPEAQKAKGERAAVNLSELPHPPVVYNEKRVMGFSAFRTTIVLAFAAIGESDCEDEDDVTELTAADLLELESGSFWSGDGEVQSRRSSHALASGYASRASRVSMVSKASFVESKEVASLASKYALSIEESSSRRHMEPEVLSARSKEARERAVRDRDQALQEVVALLHGVADQRAYWDRAFCYLKFHTIREAEFAVHHVHRALKSSTSSATMRRVLRNAYLV